LQDHRKIEQENKSKNLFEGRCKREQITKYRYRKARNYLNHGGDFQCFMKV
jgi:hypothetical protein